jgi:myo-inositol-1(or 4)-monophosphatase
LIGTANFLRGTQGFLLGLSCQVDGQLQISVFIDPLLNEEFTAIRGSGASLNGRRIRVSSRINLEDSTCAMEFAPGQEPGTQTRPLQQALEQQVRIRTTGNGILDLAMASAGRLDGGIIPKPPADQLASVALLLREAGGLVSDIEGNPKLAGDQLVFGNPKYFKQLLQLARQPR